MDSNHQVINAKAASLRASAPVLHPHALLPARNASPKGIGPRIYPSKFQGAIERLEENQSSRALEGEIEGSSRASRGAFHQ